MSVLFRRLQISERERASQIDDHLRDLLDVLQRHRVDVLDDLVS
jgi:hypothetical protein